MKKIFSNYNYKITNYKELHKIFKEKRKEVFEDTYTIWLDDLFTKEEKEFKYPKCDIFRLYILIYYKKEVVGWFMGFQKGDEFYMMNTGVFEKHQGKGIYTHLLKEIIEIIKPKGFLFMTSHHLASNNRVIVPKLKAGFHITGIEINETFGVLVNLKYTFNTEIKDVYYIRTGNKKPKAIK